MIFNYNNDNNNYYFFVILIITNIIFTFIIIIIFILSLLLFLLFFCYYCYFFLVCGSIFSEGSPFGRFLTVGYCELKEYVSTWTYLYNLTIQHCLECLVINWMKNSVYGPFQLWLDYFTGMLVKQVSMYNHSG